jgi:hypothetical protein
MAKVVKTLSVSAVQNGEHGAKPVTQEKAEDFIRDDIVRHPEKSDNDRLKEVSLKFPNYGYSSFKIATSRYNAVMREVKRIYNITLKSANPAK